jgi:hypothetical protein
MPGVARAVCGMSAECGKSTCGRALNCLAAVQGPIVSASLSSARADLKQVTAPQEMTIDIVLRRKLAACPGWRP